MKPIYLLALSILLFTFSYSGNVTLYDDLIVFVPDSVHIFSEEYLIRQSLFVVEAHDRTGGLNYSWKTLVVFIFDDSQYNQFIESNYNVPENLTNAQLFGIKADTETYVQYRIPYEDTWHVVIMNKERASHDHLEKTFHIFYRIEEKNGFLRYPGFALLLYSGVLYYKKRRETGREVTQLEQNPT